MSNPQRSTLAAVTLFFVAPLVAEYLLGDFPITFLSPLVTMAPLYGGGALLIRELTRRSGRGWPTILVLGCAYALIEEGYTTQTLFNPDIFGRHWRLLSHAWIPSLGIGAWWTLFMLNVHSFWSMGVSIALVEGLFPSRARTIPGTPWLGKIGLAVAAVLYAFGAWASTAYMLHKYRFVASTAQFAVTGVVCILLIAAAFVLPAPAPRTSAGAAPSPWLSGLAAFLLGFAVFLAPIHLNWFAVAWILAADLVFLVSLWAFSRRSSWTALHTFSIGAGGALVYAVHAFVQNPISRTPKGIALASHAFLLALAMAVIAFGARRTRSSVAMVVNTHPEQAQPVTPS